MRRGGSGLTMSFPPFTPAVKWLIISNASIFVAMLLMQSFWPGGSVLFQLGWLVPREVLHGLIWQLVTYSFFHVGLFHLLFNMLTLWMFGSQFEQDWGRKQFLEFYFFCVVGAALTTILIGYLGEWAWHIAVVGGWSSAGFFGKVASLVRTPTIGASGGIFGLLIAFGMLYGDREIFMFPLPFAIKARYMIAIWIFLAMVGSLQDAGGAANFAHLGGAFFGWFYLRFIPRRGVQVAASEGVYGIRNRYYRWKRRRAARKFEVYMRKHDRGDYFDEHGNYKEPDGSDKENGGPRSPWVN